MLFNRWMALLICASMTLTSCSWLRDQPKPQIAFDSKQLDLSCLQSMPSQLQKLFAGKYSDSNADIRSIQTIWGCLDQSLHTFSKYTHGSNSTFYTNDELQSFANRYLPADNLFSKSLVDSIFKLKAAVLGGETDRITVEEITKLRGKLNRFGEIIIPLAPHISTLLKPFETLSDGRAQMAGKQLNQFVLDIADLLGDSAKTVKWQDVSYFVGELEKYLKSPNPTSLTVIREQIQVFQYMKLMVVGGDEFGIERTKWHPILKTISIIYNALYLTATTNEMMEQLGLEIEATEEDQKKSTEMLTLILKKLKRERDVYTRSTITLLADRWAKSLILNAFLYPKSQDKLSINSFFSSPTLRRLSGFLFDDLTKVMNGDRSPEIIDRMANNLIELFEKARENRNTIINFQQLKEYMSGLKILFEEENDFQSMELIFTMIDDVSTVLIGKDGGQMSNRDFRALINKASKLYRAWNGKNATQFNLALSESLEILITKPSASAIQVDRLRSIVKNAEKLFTQFKINPGINWPEIDQMILNGAQLKSVLFANNRNQISNQELNQVLSAWNAFISQPELDDALESLARYFRNNPFSTVRIRDLMSAFDSFLPENKKLDQLGFTVSLMGPLKGFLIGGSSDLLEKSEYSKMAQMGYLIYRHLKPVIQKLPENYQAGLNSHTMAMAEAVIQGMMDGQDFTFSNGSLKELLVSQLNGPGMELKPASADRMLIALNHRVFDHNKGPKPSKFPASFPAYKLSGIRDMIKLTKLDMIDFENAFKNLNAKTALSGSAIYERLQREDSRFILRSLHPIIHGESSTPFYIADGKPNDQYYLTDLQTKAMLYQAMLWILPCYEVETDPEKPSALPRMTINDLYDLFDDINDAVFELGLSFSSDPAKISADRRMQSINLFTRTGNGDGHIDVVETVEFLTTTIAGKTLFDQIRQYLVNQCYPSNLTYRSQKNFDKDCLKNRFFEHSQFKHHYQNVIPQMVDEHGKLNSQQLDQFMDSVMVAATTPDWRRKNSFNLNDLETLVSTPYYAENIFLRLDTNYDGALKFSEGMKGFEVFCGEIKRAAGDSASGSCDDVNSRTQVEAIYGHLLIKRAPPRSIKPTDSWYEKIKIAKEFIVWSTKWKFRSQNWSKYDQEEPINRRSDLLGIMANLSVSITLTDPDAKPESSFAWTPAHPAGAQSVR
jgi:hypothetical protein